MDINIMSNKLHFTIYSPEHIYFSDYIKSATIPSISGQFQVLQNHAPILAVVEYGVLDVVGENDIKNSFFIENGITHSNENILKMNVRKIDKLIEIDTDKVKSDIVSETEMMNNATEDNIKQTYQTTIKKLETKLKFALEAQM